MLLTCLATTLFWGYSLASNAYQQPIGIVKPHTSGIGKPKDNFGIGFDFSSTFVTVAISYPNGTNLGLVKKATNNEYRQIFHHLASSSSQHTSPPYNDIGEGFRDQPRQMWRGFLKRLGQPSSNEARILGEMLKEIIPEVEDRLGYPITHAAASFPQLIALYSEDIWDAFEWAGLIYQQIIWMSRPIPDFSAAYAGFGFQLCKDYKNPVACQKEQDEIDNRADRESTVNVLLNDDALMLAWPVMYSPYQYFTSGGNVAQDFNLGLKASKSRPDYWNLIGMRLEEFFQATEWKWEVYKPEKVFVYGEGVSLELLDIVKKACSRKNAHPKLFVDEADTLMLAKGTAELAKRDLYLYPGKPHPKF
ncbi:hypothetical protein BT63DRAFT_442416 [Microthyrium microscopicum]|uniref:Actin-like ATPase domain-containing protein n=1 Tax=Microthyrium microscopicum TaxID=703497 RepID=A0A6A6U367_9PEZI|nr:hypothetical protein BT63DRAFT_442416 [Microthyrium microscopicum]